MGFINGTASFVRFSVEGDLPENVWDFIADRVVAFAFRDIDETYEEDSLGWVSVFNMFDMEFNYASYAAGNYVTLSMRHDERKVSSAIVKKYVQKEEERIKKEKQIPKISRTMRVEIKERIQNELMRKSLPVPAVYDLCWNLENSTLLFFSTNKKAQALLEDHFKESFGLTLMQQIPYICGQHLLDEKDADRLAGITADVFL
ncbi:MAG: recombination-associated protein RdgC [Proteobacteria bacterium]|nr:recombination-associated protein RdgC [Pseudomonadota bacterium]MBU1058326.1 recombination-associated protein RdgC [Pseudomonadota bacterium]